MTEATIEEFRRDVVEPLLAEPLSKDLTLNDVGNGDEWWFDINKILQAKTVGPKGQEHRQEVPGERSPHVTVFSGAAGYKSSGSKSELGIRPEFVSLSSDGSGFPVQIDAVENIGRFKIVRANLQGHSINALLKEHENVPADPTMSFETARINVYENSHLVRAGA